METQEQKETASDSNTTTLVCLGRLAPEEYLAVRGCITRFERRPTSTWNAQVITVKIDQLATLLRDTQARYKPSTITATQIPFAQALVGDMLTGRLERDFGIRPQHYYLVLTEQVRLYYRQRSPWFQLDDLLRPAFEFVLRAHMYLGAPPYEYAGTLSSHRNNVKFAHLPQPANLAV